jgi:FKBP-type peptidyl-prolyl cis-trans isomerase FklB
MKRLLALLIVGVACAAIARAQDRTPDTTLPGKLRTVAPGADAKADKSPKAIGSYGLGMNLGRSLKTDGMEIDLDSLAQGVRDGLQGVQPRYTEDELRAAFKTLQADLETKRAQREQTLGDKNKTEGEAFLAKNKSKQGVTALKSGLQYEVLRSGNGASPKAEDTVKVHYEGTLLDGTVFDSSIKRKEPAEFPVNAVIPGWTEALQLMKVGDRWRLYIPSNLAYGQKGAGGMIGPNAVLVFDVQLLDIQPPAASR